MSQRCSRVRNMPMNNNQQKVPSAAARLAKLPVVRSACGKLSVLYTDTKRSHPNLGAMCEVLENGVTALGTAACDRASPVIVKLEPQISAANDVACKSLDWLEATFPVLHAPTEQIVASARDKVHELQDVVSTAANGTAGRVQHAVTCLMERMQQVDDGGSNWTLVVRVAAVAAVGLDSALSASEALMDRVLPPTEDDKKEEEEAQGLKGSEAATLGSRYPARLVSFTVRLCRRSSRLVRAKMYSVQVMETLSRSSTLVQELQTTCLALVWSLQGLPQYLQHQAMSVLFFISQMYNPGSPPPDQNGCSEARSHLNAATAPIPPKDVVPFHPQGASTCRMRRPTKMSGFDGVCNVKGCVRR